MSNDGGKYNVNKILKNLNMGGKTNQKKIIMGGMKAITKY